MLPLARLCGLSPVALPLFWLGLGATSSSAEGAARPISGLRAAQLLAAGEPVTIVCLGDSVTGIYYHSGSKRAWSNILGYVLQGIYPAAKLTVINAGVSGNTTGQGLARMEADVLSHHPQLVVAMFGLNDIVRGGGPQEFHDHLCEMAARTRAAGGEFVLMTPNSIYAGDPTRPPLRVADYAEIVRNVGRELAVPVADTFAAFESVRSTDRRAWEHLMSDTIHPNLRGHELFAEEVAWTITGQRRWVADLPALRPGLPRVLARLRGHQPVRVVAMKPYDTLIAPALQTVFPAAQVTVRSWDPAQKSLAELAKEAQAFGRFGASEDGKNAPVDLVLLAVPAEAGAPDEEDFFREYSDLLNWMLPFAPGGWDCLAALPSVATPQLDAAHRTAEDLAREGLRGKDIAWVERPADAPAPAADLLAQRLQSLLAESGP